MGHIESSKNPYLSKKLIDEGYVGCFIRRIQEQKNLRQLESVVVHGTASGLCSGEVVMWILPRSAERSGVSLPGHSQRYRATTECLAAHL
jgi:hypothetical protein